MATTGNNKHFIHLRKDIEFLNHLMITVAIMMSPSTQQQHCHLLDYLVAVMAEEIEEEEYLRENWVGPKRKFAHLETIIMDNFRQFIINT